MDHIPLRFGSSGESVAWTQQVLGDMGYPITEHRGQFGADTLRAIIAFQNMHNLPPDGVVTADTFRAIDEYAAAKPLEKEVFAQVEASLSQPISVEVAQPNIPQMPAGWTKAD